MSTDLRPIAAIRFYGELDVATIPAMRHVLGRMLGGGPVHLSADLSSVAFIDASAVGVILAARRAAAEAGGSLTVQAPSPAVMRVLRVLNLDDALSVG